VPQSSFTRQVDVAADPARCWTTVTDVPLLVSWVSVLEDAEVQAPLEQYSAVLMDRMGPFKLRADLDITLTDVTVERHVTVHAEGEDRQVGSRVVVDVVLDIEPADGGGCTVRTEGTYGVTGRVASMGTGTIRKKAEKILDEFFGNLESTLGSA
jgi:carbon monoxide dehydrogenase subunit G